MNTHLDGKREISANYDCPSYFTKHSLMIIHSGGESSKFFFCYILFIHKFNKCLKKTEQVSHTAPGTRNGAVNRINKTSYSHVA